MAVGVFVPTPKGLGSDSEIHYPAGVRKNGANSRMEDPVSVVLPAELKVRVEREAKKRGLKLSPTIRVLVGERVRELDAAEGLDRALEWQRDQAWATWERIRAGGGDDVGFDAIEAEFDRAAPRPRRRR
jgi:hypothetical protein